jgi:hypothetical protein
LRGIFEPKIQEVAGEYCIMKNFIIRIPAIKSRTMVWAVHVTRMREMNTKSVDLKGGGGGLLGDRGVVGDILKCRNWMRGYGLDSRIWV